MPNPNAIVGRIVATTAPVTETTWKSVQGDPNATLTQLTPPFIGAT